MQCDSSKSSEDPRRPHPLPPSHKPPETKRSDKLQYCRLLSKESSLANPSFRVYYTVSSGSVPFLWESRPGTPKRSVPAAALLPPLTPPPSHQRTPGRDEADRRKRHHGLLLSTILPRLHLRKPARGRPPTLTPSPSVSSSSSSSSSISVTASLSPAARRRSRFSSARTSFSSAAGDDEKENGSDAESPKSVFCFGVAGLNMASLKNRVLMLGHGSSQRRPA